MGPVSLSGRRGLLREARSWGGGACSWQGLKVGLGLGVGLSLLGCALHARISMSRSPVFLGLTVSRKGTTELYLGRVWGVFRYILVTIDERKEPFKIPVSAVKNLVIWRGNYGASVRQVRGNVPERLVLAEDGVEQQRTLSVQVAQLCAARPGRSRAQRARDTELSPVEVARDDLRWSGRGLVAERRRFMAYFYHNGYITERTNYGVKRNRKDIEGIDRRRGM